MTVTDVHDRVGLSRRLVLPGWSSRSRWGWDPALECYWARLVPARPGGRTVRVSRRHLVPTLASLARTLAAEAGLDAGLVYVALTGGTVGVRSTPAPVRRAVPALPA